MSTQETAETRERVLMAAGQEFAAKGFKDATVREICQRARVNIAAVNYHFGDKERLYIESVKRAHGSRAEEVPLPPGRPEQPPIEAARLHPHAVGANSAHPAGEWHGAVDAPRDVPADERLRRVGARIHPSAFPGPARHPRRIAAGARSHGRRHLLAFSVIGQCVHYHVARPVVQLLVPPDEYQAYSPQYLAEHILQTMLAAIRRLDVSDIAAKGAHA